MARSIRKRLETAQAAAAERQAVGRRRDCQQYANDPVGYIRDVLGGKPWSKQEEICRLLMTPPYRVLCEASHSVGKTWLAAALTSWHFDCFDDGWTITTAPTHRDVVDLLWTEVRIQRDRAGLGGFSGERAPELWDGPDHYAKGFTAAKSESFQGRHPERLFFLFDEATGIEPQFWTTTRTMFKQSGKHHWLAILNPTDTSSQAYAERLRTDAAGRPAWHVVQMSTLDHPNLAAGLDGKALPYPGAVDLDQFSDWLAAWSDPIDPDDRTEIDLEWPPNSGKWWRPGPLMEGRALGRYPSSATYGVWSDRAWQLATALTDRQPDLALLPEIGCDVARQGDDYTAIHVRWGHISLHHERHNGWEYPQTADRLKALCHQYADYINARRDPQSRPVRPQEILVKVDADAYGHGVIDMRDDYNFQGLGASWRSLQPRRYPNRRSELWFNLVRLAKKNGLCLARLAQEHVNRLRQQCFSPQWSVVGGLQVVEPKDRTKQRLGYSPDDADAMNLAYAETVGLAMPEGVDTDDLPPPRPAERERDRNRDREPGGRHGLFGR